MAATTPQDGSIEFRELSGARPLDVDILRRFYAECYEPAFPDPNERESLANMVSYLALKEQGWYGQNNYHIVVALNGDEIVGGSVCDYLAEPNAGVVEYLLIQPDFRTSGLGANLLTAVERLCRADAAEIGGRELDWIVGETEDPYRNPPSSGGFDTFARARVMDRMDLRILDFRYIQPALSEAQEPAENLLLIARPCGRVDVIRTDVVLSILAEYMRWAMRIADPANNNDYRKMARAVAWRPTIGLVEFADYLGWDRQGHLRITDVTDPADPELAAAIGVYESVYADPETAWPGDIFRAAVERGSRSTRPGYVYHFWAIRSTASGPCDGMASFLSMPTAGFGGYLAFDRPLRGAGRLHEIVARIEERMLRDNPDIRGWYVECNEEVNCEIFAKVGFFELDVAYEQPLSTSSGTSTPPLPLHLLYKPLGRVYQPPSIDRAEFLRAVAEIYWSIYDVDAETNASYRRLADSLTTRDKVSAVRPGSLIEVDTGDKRVTASVDRIFDESHSDGAGFTGSVIDHGSAERVSGRMEQIVRVIRLSASAQQA